MVHLRSNTGINQNTQITVVLKRALLQRINQVDLFLNIAGLKANKSDKGILSMIWFTCYIKNIFFSHLTNSNQCYKIS